MLDQVFKHAFFQTLTASVEHKTNLILEGLWDSPKALIAAYTASLNKTVLFITGGAREDALFHNLSYLTPNLAIEFPAWETFPGEDIAPSPDLLGKRFETVHHLLTQKKPTILLTPLQAILQKIPSKDTLSPLLSIWAKKKKISFSAIPSLLTSLGFKKVAVVSEKGEFALRGSIVDLFPTGSPTPFRLDFFEDELEEIRTFDPIGQKTTGKVDQFLLSPVQESPFLKETSSLTSLIEYLPKDVVVVWDDLLKIEEAYLPLQKLSQMSSSFFYTLDELLQSLASFPQIFCTSNGIDHFGAICQKNSLSFELFGVSLTAQSMSHPFLPTQLHTSKTPLIFLIQHPEEKEWIEKKYPDLIPQADFQTGLLTSGFTLSDSLLTVAPYGELSGKTTLRRQKWRTQTHATASEFHHLSPGDFVVHFHSGIGRFLGLETHTNHLKEKTDFLVLEYQEESKLFVPLSQSHLISRYIGANETSPTLNQLGGKKWQTTKTSAQKAIVGYANDLLALYAQRSLGKGFCYPSDGDLMQEFERVFPYEETEDQRLAIEAIKQDLCSSKTMDRLICGDVGYGKTEVAMRAAFKAVVDGGKQVAVLVPTTVLAMQHFDTFSERMSSFPVKVGVVSRFRTLKETKEILAQVEKGQVDILIGTHRILSQDVHFKNLGLMIIDEEQRFGVRAKEHLKKFKGTIDCLTLSATPIPRTLYMSLVNARDLSTINTPPQDRLPIKTIVAETDLSLIQNAIVREKGREGQIFYIHNRVDTIYERASLISKLVPSLRIGVVHGQLDPSEIDQIFHQFKQGTIDLLFATTIVESGIDIPNANTILIDRADTYGLADLYQLRGRVGRWNRTAYAYFLIPKNLRLSEIAQKRLHALAEAGAYGGGMKIAMRDLEIRGAGDILGVQQSGQVSAIGFHLYCKLLKKAVEALKKNQPISFHEVKIEFPYDAKIPESYIDAVSVRMEIYHRMGDASSEQDITELLKELQDRFGPVPASVLWLAALNRIRAFASLHTFSLLQFQSLVFVAEKQKGQILEKKHILLPKKKQTPEELGPYVIEELKKAFALKTVR